MIIIRSIVGLIGIILTLAFIIIALVIAGLMTLYWGFVEKDWRKEEWAEFPLLLKEIYNEIKNFILDK